MHRLYDVGIAGIHRLFASLDTVRRSHACVAVAGMDGALPTVVAGAWAVRRRSSVPVVVGGRHASITYVH